MTRALSLVFVATFAAACGSSYEADCNAACDSLTTAQLDSCKASLEACDVGGDLLGLADACKQTALAGYEALCGTGDTDTDAAE